MDCKLPLWLNALRPRCNPFVAVADVAVSGARPGSDGILSYAVPPALADSIDQGQLVWVPLRAKPALGLITRLHDEQPSFPAQAAHQARRAVLSRYHSATRFRHMAGARSRLQSL